MDLERLITFSRMLNSFANIERAVPRPGTTRRENDMEHSYHLALMAWYLIDSTKLDLDVARAIRYALAHDLVEVHAGDTYLWDKNEALHASKKEREARAAEQLVQEYPEFRELHATIAEYEARETAESRFVYALDKVLPMILIRDEGGSLWREEGVTLDMIIHKKKEKVALSPEIEPYYDQLFALIKKEGLTSEAPDAPETP